MPENQNDDFIRNVDRSTLTGIARVALKDRAAELIDWHYKPLRNERDVVSRFSGNAMQLGGQVPWSAILKRYRGKSNIGDPHGRVREPIIYSSNFIQNLPCRITIPRCLEITQQSDEPDWIWIEEIVENDSGEWSIGHFKEAAFHLGQINAVTMEGSVRPDWPWIKGPTNLRDFVDRFAVSESKLAEGVGFWHDKLSMSSTDVERLYHMNVEKERYLRILDSLPRCISHGDADRRNFLFRTGVEGNEEIVGIDWAFAGLSVLGDDSQNMVNGSITHAQFPADEYEALDEVVFAGYVQGLEASGWSGDVRIVRLGHTCASALKWGLSISGVAAQGREYPQELLDRVRLLIPRRTVHSLEAESLSRELGMWIGRIVDGALTRRTPSQRSHPSGCRRRSAGLFGCFWVGDPRW